jgi:hypothetical protein
MTKRKVSQLFTAIVLATSAPAAAAVFGPPDAAFPRVVPLLLPNHAPANGNVLWKGDKPRRAREADETRARSAKDERAREAAKKKAHAEVARRTQQVRAALLAIFGAADAARPRQLTSGAPACGNVASRAARPCEPAAVEPKSTTSN